MILFVGRVEPLKGIDTLLQAVALTVNDPSMRRAASPGVERPPQAAGQSSPGLGHLCLSVIGGDAGEDPARLDGEMRRLHQLRADLGLTDLVTFLGKQAQDTLPYYYSAAEVVVVPSHYESFGMVALEAMACGAPVIASDVGGLSFTVANGLSGFLVPARDPQALAEKLRLLLTDSALRHELGARAVERARNYAWSIVADQIVEVYQELLRHRHHDVADDVGRLVAPVGGVAQVTVGLP